MNVLLTGGMGYIGSHVAAFAWLNEHPGWHAINLGAGQGCSVLEIDAGSVHQRQCSNHALTQRHAGDVAACYANPEKALRELGWRAQRGLLDMCARAWKFQSRTSI